jgi:hypothetical protein
MILMGHAGDLGRPVTLLRLGRKRRRGGGGAVRQDLDDRVHDVVALDEISLYGDVLSAVAAADRPLTSAEIDSVLGIETVLGISTTDN